MRVTARDEERERRRRLDEVFGDVLPDVTGDERDEQDDGSAARDRDGWLRDQVPPHHGELRLRR